MCPEGTFRESRVAALLPPRRPPPPRRPSIASVHPAMHISLVGWEDAPHASEEAVEHVARAAPTRRARLRVQVSFLRSAPLIQAHARTDTALQTVWRMLSLKFWPGQWRR
eukprot:scaffold80602_cov59-Phaeocystis_antarctica.AAC.4